MDGSPRKRLPSEDIDVEKVTSVNQWAHDHGYTVLWFRLPPKAHPQPIAENATH
jgi:hypothetical protein